MSCDSYTAALDAVLIHEGGYTDNPHDPGGATNFGVTQEVYDDFRTGEGNPFRSVREITRAEVEAIYRHRYWNVVRGDDLPAGVDYATFDFAVNSGTNRAIRFLQRSVGALEDGKIGPQTLGFVKSMPPFRVIDALCDFRLSFLKSLNAFQYFGRGWTRRVEEVRNKAKELAS